MRARAAAAADATLAQTLPAALMAIDEAERLALKAARAEVYVGFYELENARAGVPAAAPALDPQLSRAELAKLECKRTEEAAMEAARQEHIADLPDIPSAIACDLGPDGVQALWEFAVDRFVTARDMNDADSCIWTETLPSFARKVLSNATLERAKHEWDLESAQIATRDAEKQIAEVRAEMREIGREMGEMEEAHEVEVARLKGELREAKGREEALQGVIAQWMSAHGV